MYVAATFRQPSRADDASDRLTFRDVAAANRAVATLNAHPALLFLGGWFCAPGTNDYPALSELFTVRELVGETYVGGRKRPARAPWMDRVRDMRGNSAPWASRLPTSDEIYDHCGAFGPVFQVRVRRRELWRDKGAWHASVQFFNVADADRMQRAVDSAQTLFGWKVCVLPRRRPVLTGSTCGARQVDFAVQNFRDKMEEALLRDQRRQEKPKAASSTLSRDWARGLVAPYACRLNSIYTMHRPLFILLYAPS